MTDAAPQHPVGTPAQVDTLRGAEGDNAVPRAGWTVRRLLEVSLLRNAELATYLLVTIALTPILFDRLGAEDYGIWLLLISQVPLMRLFDPGIHPILLNTVIDRRVRGMLDTARDVVANGLRLGAGICLAVSATLLLGGGALLDRLGIDLGTAEHERFLLLAPVALFAAGLLGGIPDAVLFGMNRFAPSIVTGISITIVNAALSAGLVLAGYGLPAVILATVGSQTALLMAKFVLARALVPQVPVSFRRRQPHASAWRPLVAIGPWSTLIAVSWVAGYNTDNLVVGSLLSLSALGGYAVTQRIPNALRTILQSTFSVLFPYTAELHSRELQPQLRRAVLSGTKAATCIGILTVLGLWDLGPRLLELWVGPVDDGALLLRLGLVTNIMFAIRVIPDNVLFAAGAARYLAIVLFASAVANVALSISLTAVLGTPGPLLGSLISGAASLVFLAYRVAAIAGLPARAYALETIGKPALAALPAAGLLLASHALAPTHSLAIAAIATLVGLLYGVTVATVALNSTERALLGRRLHLLRQRW